MNTNKVHDIEKLNDRNPKGFQKQIEGNPLESRLHFYKILYHSNHKTSRNMISKFQEMITSTRTVIESSLH